MKRQETVLLTVSSMAFFAAAVLPGCAPSEANSSGNSPQKATAVKTVSVIQQEVEQTSVQPATIHPYHSTEIRARVSGYVSEVRADIGDVVEAGAVLCVVDIPELEKQKEVLVAKHQGFQAHEQQAIAGIDLSKAQVQAAEARLAQAQSEIARVTASLAAAEAEFRRTEDLVNKQSLQSRVLDEVRKRRDSERAARESVVSAIQSAEANVIVAGAQQAAAEADLVAAKAETLAAQRQIDELDVMIRYSQVMAPFDGVITQRFVEPGELISKGESTTSGKPLFVVQKIDKLRVHIPVPEKDAAMVNRGDKITLTFPFFSDEEALIVDVTRMSGSLDPSTRTMLIEAEVDNPNGKLIPGMFGQASIHLSTRADANMLPARAVRFDEKGNAYVYLVNAEQTVSVVDVTTGMDDGSTIEILSGVSAGDQVIDAHLKRFVSGERVDILSN